MPWRYRDGDGEKGSFVWEQSDRAKKRPTGLDPEIVTDSG